MKPPVPINLAVEDDLSAWIVRRALSLQSERFCVGDVYQRSGFGYLKRMVNSFNQAAKYCPFLLLTDLDQHECPPKLIAKWLTTPRHKMFLFRVAVREVESWLLGDSAGLSDFLSLRRQLMVSDPEALADPKRELLAAAMRCPSRKIRDALVWRDQQSGRLYQGPDYNHVLVQFVDKQWDVDVARGTCPSLQRMFDSLQRLENTYGIG